MFSIFVSDYFYSHFVPHCPARHLLGAAVEGMFILSDQRPLPSVAV
jgi:hypothetical protein